MNAATGWGVVCCWITRVIYGAANIKCVRLAACRGVNVYTVCVDYRDAGIRPVGAVNPEAASARFASIFQGYKIPDRISRADILYRVCFELQRDIFRVEGHAAKPAVSAQELAFGLWIVAGVVLSRRKISITIRICTQYSVYNDYVFQYRIV